MAKSPSLTGRVQGDPRPLAAKADTTSGGTQTSAGLAGLGSANPSLVLPLNVCREYVLAFRIALTIDINFKSSTLAVYCVKQTLDV